MKLLATRVLFGDGRAQGRQVRGALAQATEPHHECARSVDRAGLVVHGLMIPAARAGPVTLRTVGRRAAHRTPADL
jgi:hypothetical protein